MPIEPPGVASIPALPINAQDEALIDKLVRERAPRQTKKVPLHVEDEEVETIGSTIQIALVGAMQRAHPALTQLWLRWLGVPDLEHTTFDLSTPQEYGGEPATRVTIGSTASYQEAWSGLCDLMGLAEGAPERQQNPIHIVARHPAHETFWLAAQRRELQEVDGPLEWWWRLLVLRCRGVRPASRLLLGKLFGDEPDLDGAILRLHNPTLKAIGRTASEIIEGQYVQPTDLVIALRANRRATTEGLALPLSNDKVKTHFIPTLLRTAVSSDLSWE